MSLQVAKGNYRIRMWEVHGEHPQYLSVIDGMVSIAGPDVPKSDQEVTRRFLTVSPSLDIHHVTTKIYANTISLPVTIKRSEYQNIETLTLIDSGAGGQFIHQEYVKQLGLPTEPLKKDELIFRFLPTSQWSVEVLENGNVAIQYPAHLRPSRSLSYEKPAEEGKRIILGPVSDFPSCEWRVDPAPQEPLPVPFLSVWNSDFSFYLLTDYLSELAAFVSLTRISS